MQPAVTLLIGTTKGAFRLASDAGRKDWRLDGPGCDLWPINHVIGDPETGRIWAGGGNGWTGAGVWRSEDGGESWTLSKLSAGEVDAFIAGNPGVAESLGFTPSGPAQFTGEVEAVWSLAYSGGTLWCGTKPGGLYASADGGENWERVEGIANHPSRKEWTPGGAGLVLHTILPHPVKRGHIIVGISAAGIFGTEDGGENWDRLNRRSNESHAHLDHPAAGSDSEIGHCVHNMVRGAGGGDLIYQQNHHGVFRSGDGGRSWHDVTEGLPSTFGFPVAAHPRDPHTLWTLPLNSDVGGRFPPEAAAAVWRSRDGGENWEALREGLPQENCFFTVLRQAMASDRGKPAGVYFGTNSGSVFATADEGDSWSEIARHLPTVLSVEVLERT